MTDAESEFDAFFTKEYTAVVWHLAALGIPPHLAQESASDAMLKASLQWDNLIDPHRWVRRVATRDGWHAYHREITGREREREAHRLEPHSHEQGLEQWVDSAEQRRAALEIMLSLPAGQRAVLAWTFDGYTYAEIAGLTGLAASTVRSHLRHARKRLEATFTRSRREEDGE